MSNKEIKKLTLTDDQLELAKEELQKREQEKQLDLQNRTQQCLKEIEAACEKYSLTLQAPISKFNILEYHSKILEKPNLAFGVTIELFEKQEIKG